MSRFEFVLVASVLGAVSNGCAGGDGGSGDGNIAGVARVVQGATAPTALQITSAVSFLPTDGSWHVSPDQVRMRITRVNLEAATPETGTGSDFEDCVVTYDRSNTSGFSLLDCPFALAPGTYFSMNLFLDPTADILISDAVNGIFTDPGAPGGLSNTAPAGGADFVSVTSEFGWSFLQYFSSPLVIGSEDSLSISLAVDAIQTTRVTVSNAGSTLEFSDYFPAVVFPSIGAAGSSQYYTSTGTADSYNDSLVLAQILRIYRGPGVDGQPVRASFDQRAGDLNTCTAGAYNDVFPADPAQTTQLANGDRAGGWLGRDDANTLCWAMADNSYSTYISYMTMPQASTIGESMTVSCEPTTSPSPPVTGATYASGCPSLVGVPTTASLTLVAD